MPEAPYRPSPPPSEAAGELTRLAAEGQSRLRQASAAEAAAQRKVEEQRRRAEERHLRVALGDHYGAPVRTAAVTAMAAGALACAAALVAGTYALVAPGAAVAFVALLARAFAPPRAARARVVAETAWVDALPFPVHGYFEVLREEPAASCRLGVALVWGDPRTAPGRDVLKGALGVVDAGATVDSREGSAVIASGPLSCRTWIRLEDGPLCRNTRIVAYVHELVDEVLLPVHRTSALAEVSLQRITCSNEPKRVDVRVR